MNTEALTHLRISNRGRYLCSLFTPQSCREAIIGLYSWAEELDEIKYRVSEPMLGHIRFQWWRETIDVAFAQHHSENPLLISLMPWIKSGHISQTTFEILLGAYEREIDSFHPGNLQELETFIEHKYLPIFEIAGSILAGSILTAQAKQALYHVALAYGHVEILSKAVPLTRKGICYLPVDLLEEAGITAEEITAVENKDIIKEITQFLTQRAKIHVSQARSYRKYAPKVLLPILYHSIITDDRIGSIKRHHYQLFAVYPSGFRIRTYLRLLFGGILGTNY